MVIVGIAQKGARPRILQLLLVPFQSGRIFGRASDGKAAEFLAQAKTQGLDVSLLAGPAVKECDATVVFGTAANVNVLFVSKTVPRKAKVVHWSLERFDIDAERVIPGSDNSAVATVAAVKFDGRADIGQMWFAVAGLRKAEFLRSQTCKLGEYDATHGAPQYEPSSVPAETEMPGTCHLFFRKQPLRERQQICVALQ